MYCLSLPILAGAGRLSFRLTTATTGTTIPTLSVVPARNASKKASGGTRNPKGSKGQGRSIKIRGNEEVLPGHTLATQIRPYWLPGLNVDIIDNKDLALIALVKGRIVVTSEQPDLDPAHPVNQRVFGEMIGHKFKKKYIHVIPDPQHVRFKLIDQV